MIAVPEPIQESAVKTTTLRQIWQEVRDPELYVRDMFSTRDLDTPMRVYEVAPGSLKGARGKEIRYLVRAAVRGERGAIVAEYRTDPGPPVVLMGERILDGQHRAMAAYLEKRLVEAVQADELPET